MTHRHSVRLERFNRMILGRIHGVIPGAVHDHVRLHIGHGGSDGLTVSDIQTCTSERDDLGNWGKVVNHGCAELAA
jgi:hypothetical protein